MYYYIKVITTTSTTTTTTTTTTASLAPQCANNRCSNGGTCVPFMSIYTCQCPPGFTGYFCTSNVQTLYKNK